MGPRLNSRGDSDAHLSERPAIEASMGPRLNSRGDACTSGRALSSSSTASMGPRLNSRGDDFESCVETTLEFVLQWGRDLIVAETYEEIFNPRKMQSFNGAAT